MKRFWWLLVLPYVVISTIHDPKIYCVTQDDELVWCDISKEKMKRLAALLNSQTAEKADSKHVFSGVTDGQVHFSNKDACGADDCGQEPK